jgi:hypothetical protein
VRLARTVCELLGAEPAAAFAAPGLLESSSGGEHPALLHAYGNFWGAPWEAQRDQSRKWIAIPQKGLGAREELYDYRADPREQRNLLPGGAEAAEPLRRAQRELHERAAREQWRPGPPARLAPETLKRLQNTGYAGEEPR